MNHSSFGQFLEYSVPTDDIQASLSFYQSLGFTELPVGDIRNYYYGVVTDGRIAIGLHSAHIYATALTFINPDVARYALDIDPDDLVFSSTGSDDFNEIGLHSPSGLLLVMLEARTFSSAGLDHAEESLLGQAAEVSLGYRDTELSVSFWTAAGFAADDTHKDSVSLLTPGLCIGLRDHLKPGMTALRYALNDLDAVRDALDKRGIRTRNVGDRSVLTAPEGTQLELVSRD